jgi:AraC-like DNA-binding protein
MVAQSRGQAEAGTDASSNAGEPAYAAVRAESTHTQTPEYVRDFARVFNAETAHTLTTTFLKTAQLSATHMSATGHGPGMSSTLPEDDAYILGLHLKHSGRAELWKRGKMVPTDAFAPGSISLEHLTERPAANLPDPFECILFHLPQSALDEMAAQSGLVLPGDLQSVNHRIDPVLYHLGLALIPAIDDPQLAGTLFFDHVTQAVHARLVAAYGPDWGRAARRGRRLSRAQEELAKELLVANLSQEPRLAEVAQACGLPVRQFVYAFRNSVGAPPFRWLRAYRIERTKHLLRHTQLSLAAIGQECGFADQSHFTRSFFEATGTTPGAWRRQCGS